MSRTLARLRAATGDQLLVRAGRRLVPTPHATALRERVHAVAREAQAVLRPAAADLDLATLSATFTLRAAASFMEMLGGPVVAAIGDVAPGVRVRFVPRLARDPGRCATARSISTSASAATTRRSCTRASCFSTRTSRWRAAATRCSPRPESRRRATRPAAT
jgi:hypothetical protein